MTRLGSAFTALIVLFYLLFVPFTLASTNTDKSTQELNNEFQKAVENYNQVVVNKNSSWDDIQNAQIG
jgi:hypothetical protein